MYNLTTKIDDSCPLINYHPPGAWVQENNETDGSAALYYADTFTRSTTSGSSASFSFNGTAVTIMGAKTSYHGPYSVELDGTTQEFTAFVPGDAEFQVPLFTVDNLPQGRHNVSLTSIGYEFVDIDYITWTSNIGADDDTGPPIDMMIDDTDPTFHYTPSLAWSTNPDNLGSFMGGSGHTTSAAGASVIYTFTGDVISLFGTVGPQNSPYTVQVDGWLSFYFNATRKFFVPESLLFFADNLGPGNHTLTLTSNQPHASGMVTQFDYATVREFASSQPVSSAIPASPSPTPPTQPQTSSLTGGVIAAITISALMVTFLLVALWFLTRRNKTLWMRLQNGYMVQSQFDSPFPSTYAVNALPAPHSQNIGRSSRFKSEPDPDPHLTTEALGAQPLTRGISMQSTPSASTASVDAQDGSNVTVASVLRPLRLKFITGRGTVSRPRGGRPQERLRRSPSTRHLLNDTRYVEGEAEIESEDHSGDRVEEEMMEDFGHIPVEGEPAPPAYWQATRRTQRS